MQRRLIVLYMLISTLAVHLAMLAATGQSGNQYSPTFSPGYLIAWLVCNGRKRNPIGGWLLFFYWQIYSGLLITWIMHTNHPSERWPRSAEATSCVSKSV
jgi:hypothetical protein